MRKAGLRGAGRGADSTPAPPRGLLGFSPFSPGPPRPPPPAGFPGQALEAGSRTRARPHLARAALGARAPEASERVKPRDFPGLGKRAARTRGPSPRLQRSHGGGGAVVARGPPAPSQPEGGSPPPPALTVTAARPCLPWDAEATLSL